MGEHKSSVTRCDEVFVPRREKETMSDTTPQANEESPTPSVDETSPEGQNEEPQTQNEFKSEESKQAVLADLVSERDARKQADKRISELEDQLAQASSENDAALQSALDTTKQAQAESTRFKIAARFGISVEPGENDQPSDADLFLTASTEDELLAQAQRLSSFRKASLEDGLVDLNQGGSGKPAPPSTADQFAQQLEDF